MRLRDSLETKVLCEVMIQGNVKLVKAAYNNQQMKPFGRRMKAVVCDKID